MSDRDAPALGVTAWLVGPLGLVTLVFTEFNLRARVSNDVWSFCVGQFRGGVDVVGEGVHASWARSFVPFGIECIYSDDTAQVRQFHDMGTPMFVIGAGLLLLGLVCSVVWIARQLRSS